ncbi:hypothetical protein [Streptomyces gobiensis]|uniref:hypothetical protein n=1 Tax=Streptomyces gobiensis TaxID=2875706 RepID=UPI001E429643|nr:hypothetical protein [Streptomyces gobiensis]UGY92870.1 hypothetical protein test1122_14915 [Streptomyces gobiensis]
MPNATDLRKTLTDPKPLYAAAGVIEKVRNEAPDRIAKIVKVKDTDPKVVQDKFQGFLSTLDADIKKLREQAQHLALQGVGYTAEAVVKAKESYDSLAEQGKVAVESWRGKEEGEAATYETTIEREPVTVVEPEPEADAEPKKAAPRRSTAAKKTTAKKTTPKSDS